MITFSFFGPIQNLLQFLNKWPGCVTPQDEETKTIWESRGWVPLNAESTRLWNIVSQRFYLEHTEFCYYEYPKCVAGLVSKTCMDITIYLHSERNRQDKLKKPVSNKAARPGQR